MRSSMTVMGMLALVGLSSSASAMQARPGSECVVYAGPGCSLNYGTCENRGSSTQLIDCPLVRTGAGISSVTLFAEDNNASADVSCRLCTVRHINYDRMVYCTGYQSTTGSSGINTWLSFSSPGIYDAYAVYFVGCSVPPAVGASYSAINSYYMTET